MANSFPQYAATSHSSGPSHYDPSSRPQIDEKYLGFSSGFPLLAGLLESLRLPRSSQSPRFTSDSWLYGLITSTDVPQIPVPSRSSMRSMFDLVLEVVTPLYPLFSAPHLQRLIDEIYLNSALTRTEIKQSSLSAFVLAYASALNILSRKDQNLSSLLLPSVNFARAGFKELISSPSPEAIWCLMSLSVLNHACDLTTPIWYATGSAMRMCIELDLYRASETSSGESARLGVTPSASQATSERENFLRRLFWTTYSVERGLCLILGRPVDRLDHLITCPFPTDVSERALNRFKIRRIQSRILRHLSNSVFPAPPSPQLYNDWESQIRDWFDATDQSVEERLQYTNTLLLILRPGLSVFHADACLKSTHIAVQNLGLYTTDAIEIAMTEGILLVHDLFNNIITLLFAFHFCASVRDTFAFHDVLEILDGSRRILLELGRRWRSARDSLELMDSIIERINMGFVDEPFQQPPLQQQQQPHYAAQLQQQQPQYPQHGFMYGQPF